MKRWWPEIGGARLAAVRGEFERAARLSYDRAESERGAAAYRQGDESYREYWQRTVETWSRGSGVCRDKALALVTSLDRKCETVLLALVDSGRESLRPYSGLVDGRWITCPGSDHAVVLWLIDVPPDAEGDAMHDAWVRSRIWNMDPTWDNAQDAADAGHRINWTWDPRDDAWRKHW